MRHHRLSEHIRILPGDYTEEAGARAAETLLRTADLPTAIVASNDRSALRFLDVLNRAGLDVPAAISVVGYDDSPAAKLAHVNLPTVSQNARQQAEHAVQATVERLDNGRTDHREVVLEPHLVVRGTTAPPRSASSPPGPGRGKRQAGAAGGAQLAQVRDVVVEGAGADAE